MTYYVYELIDPFTEIAFYVGKGKGARMHHHEAEARKGLHSRKCDRIRSIWAAGGVVQKRVVSRHEDENEALQAECDLIVTYGLKSLTNVHPGGKMGQEAYLRSVEKKRIADELRKTEDLRSSLETIAPQLAMAKASEQWPIQIGAYVGSKWLDFTAPLLSLLGEAERALGSEYVTGVLARYTVSLKRAA